MPVASSPFGMRDAPVPWIVALGPVALFREDKLSPVGRFHFQFEDGIIDNAGMLIVPPGAQAGARAGGVAAAADAIATTHTTPILRSL